jgi:VCBS repeat-containing protein
MRPSYKIRPLRRSTARLFFAAETLESRVLLAAPVAQDDAVATTENTVLMGDVLADNGFGADSDADADPLSVAAVNGNAGAVGMMLTLASGAHLTVNGDGTFTYDPSGAFNSLTFGQTAMETFTYRVTDGGLSSNTATVTVTISGANTPPVVSGEIFQVDKFDVLNANVLANDTDADGHALGGSAVNASGAAVGMMITLASGSTLRVDATGTFDFSAGGKLKRLEAGEFAMDSFSYTVSDGHGGTGMATATIRVDGTGTADLVGFYQGTWNLGKSTGSAFATSTTAGAITSWDALAYGDFNADGRTDVVGLLDGIWQVGLANGSGFSFSVWTGWADVAWTNVTTGDLNGDGRDDILARLGGSWWVALSTGTSFAAPSPWTTWSNIAWQHVTLTDLDNDGKDDLLAYVSGEWWAGLSNGVSFNAPSLWARWAAVAWDGLGVFDFNHDGRSDIYGLFQGGWFVGQSTGNKFATSLRIQWSNVAWKDVVAGDFNGDGRDDLAARAGGAWWVTFSGVGVGGQGSPTTRWTVWSDLNWLDVRVGDFNGDGMDDIAGRNAVAWWVATSQGLTASNKHWATWSNVAWTAVAAADFDGTVPPAQVQAGLASAAAWTKLSEDAEFAAKLLAS